MQNRLAQKPLPMVNRCRKWSGSFLIWFFQTIVSRYWDSFTPIRDLKLSRQEENRNTWKSHGVEMEFRKSSLVYKQRIWGYISWLERNAEPLQITFPEAAWPTTSELAHDPKEFDLNFRPRWAKRGEWKNYDTAVAAYSGSTSPWLDLYGIAPRIL